MTVDYQLFGLLVIGGLAMILRWAFGSGRRRSPERADFGLLVPATVEPDRARADAVCDRLATHGIRGTVAAAGPGFDAQGRPWPSEAVQVLVFPKDLPRARELAGKR